MDKAVSSPAFAFDGVVDFAKDKLENHPVYAMVDSPQKLAVFMQHHVFSVWDFMSLIKYLHANVPPTGVPWVQGDTLVRRFVNELLMEEESDEAPPELGFDAEYVSHYELYKKAMSEIGADHSHMDGFISLVETQGIDAALNSDLVPAPSRKFSQETFSFITGGKAHEVAAALAFGREHIIPWMFRRILKDIGVGKEDAPAFHYYLKRHIHLDADHHGPLSIRLVEMLCANDPVKFDEALAAARRAVEARIAFWDGVQLALQESP